MNKLGTIVFSALIGAMAGYLIGKKLFPYPDEEYVQEELDFEAKPEVQEGPIVADLKKSEVKPKYKDYSTPVSISKNKSINALARERLGDEAIDEDDLPNLHVISLEEYAVSTNRKVVLTFYDEDDVLTDNDSNPIADPDALLGPEGLMAFGEGSGDPDTVYVRNDDRATDYEVVRLHKSYAVAVAPMKEIKDHTKRRRVKKVIDYDEPDEGEE